jgi:hypothetical protein
MAKPCFVSITAIALLAALREVGEKITSAGGSYQEYVAKKGTEVYFDFHHHSGRGVVRVYTTLSNGADQLRACDSDAMRVVLGVIFDGEFKPLGKSRKVLRTARNDLHPQDRPQACLDRLVDTVREGYSHAHQIEVCPDCGCPMVLRRPKRGAKKQFKPFFGCVDYPTCKATRRA